MQLIHQKCYRSVLHLSPGNLLICTYVTNVVHLHIMLWCKYKYWKRHFLLQLIWLFDFEIAMKKDNVYTKKLMNNNKTWSLLFRNYSTKLNLFIFSITNYSTFLYDGYSFYRMSIRYLHDIKFSWLIFIIFSF